MVQTEVRKRVIWICLGVVALIFVIALASQKQAQPDEYGREMASLVGRGVAIILEAGDIVDRVADQELSPGFGTDTLTSLRDELDQVVTKMDEIAVPTKYEETHSLTRNAFANLQRTLTLCIEYARSGGEHRLEQARQAKDLAMDQIDEATAKMKEIMK